MMSSAEPNQIERQRMTTLMMDTISSAESHATSHFIGDRGAPKMSLQSKPQQMIDPNYMERIRAVAPSASSQELKTQLQMQSESTRKEPQHATLDYERNEYKIGELPTATSATNSNRANVVAQPNKNGLLILASRPQNYESISLTNSTEFG